MGLNLEILKGTAFWEFNPDMKHYVLFASQGSMNFFMSKQENEQTIINANETVFFDKF